MLYTFFNVQCLFWISLTAQYLYLEFRSDYFACLNLILFLSSSVCMFWQQFWNHTTPFYTIFLFWHQYYLLMLSPLHDVIDKNFMTSSTLTDQWESMLLELCLFWTNQDGEKRRRKIQKVRVRVHQWTSMHGVGFL